MEKNKKIILISTAIALVILAFFIWKNFGQIDTISISENGQEKETTEQKDLNVKEAENNISGNNIDDPSNNNINEGINEGINDYEDTENKNVKEKDNTNIIENNKEQDQNSKVDKQKEQEKDIEHTSVADTSSCNNSSCDNSVNKDIDKDEKINNSKNNNVNENSNNNLNSRDEKGNDDHNDINYNNNSVTNDKNIDNDNDIDLNTDNENKNISDCTNTDERNSNSNSNIIFIALFGIDQRIQKIDAVILLKYQVESKKAILISIPRDILLTNTKLESKITGGLMDNINLARKRMESLLQINLDYYASCNFDGFIKIVDLMGGVRVNSSRLDGNQALIQLRTASSDVHFQQQQKMLLSLAKKIITVRNIPRIPLIISLIQNNIESNINWRIILDLIWNLKDIKNLTVEQYTLRTSPVENDSHSVQLTDQVYLETF